MRSKCSAAGDDDAVTLLRISEYKHKTLPVLGYLEDIDKLDIIPVVFSCHIACVLFITQYELHVYGVVKLFSITIKLS